MNQKLIWPAIAVIATLMAGAEGVMLWRNQPRSRGEQALRKYRRDCVDELMSRAGIPITIAVDSCSCGEAVFDETGSMEQAMRAAGKCVDPDQMVE